MLSTLFATALLTFSQFADYQPQNNESVQLRGFVYETNDGHFYLADQPNIKSCCIGKKGYQIPMTGDLAASKNNVVVVEGEIDDEGVKRSIINAKIIKPENSSWSMAFLGIPFLALPLFYRYSRKKIKK